MANISRPKTTAELICRLKDLDLSSHSSPTIGRHGDPSERSSTTQRHQSKRTKQEAAALHALSRSMIQTFSDDPRPSYAVEAASLSPFTSRDDYQTLFEAFLKSIATDLGDNSVPKAQLLTSFSTLLHCSQAERAGNELPLGNAIHILTTRLTKDGFTADDTTQYRLLRTLSVVLDVMNEVKSKGISDVHVVQPLLIALKDASEHRELRISQAARYAYQALRNIPSDVSPWKKLGANAYSTLKASAMIAGSVSSLDPAKLLEGLEVIGEVAKEVTVITDVIDEIRTIAPLPGVRKPAQWYFALRYTDLLIRGRNVALLKSLLESPSFPFQRENDFLCGLCAQLEKATDDDDPENGAIPVLVDFLIGQNRKSRSERVHEWVSLVTGKVEPPQSAARATARRLLPKLFGGTRKYAANIGYREMLSLIPGGDLLSRAWSTCQEARIFYADELIRSSYTNEALEQLKIQRIGSNESLPMDKCYINLTILQSADKNALPSLHRRLAIWEPDESSRVSLSNLFQPISDSNSFNSSSRVDQCKRVLIRGQAGVGKSTLCKKIVYECIHHNMWDDTIDRVIWLPLRQLKGQDKRNYNIAQLLHERYFKGEQDGDLLFDALDKTFAKEGDRTLFILDGLDEVEQDVEHSNLLRLLLHESRVIMTTRPYAANLPQIRNIDREFETVGFYPEQVERYIEAVAPGNAVSIKHFLRSHPAIEGLARIPVQLDAFCYSFEGGDIYDSHVPQTMTELYASIEQAMWKKDVVHLEKRRRGRSEVISRSDAWRSNSYDVQALVQGEVNVLQALAFDGFSQNREEFDSQYLSDFWAAQQILTSHLPSPEFPAWSGDLYKLSLFRTSDGRATSNSSYHFIHLTFQEYFAAQYFVQHWPSKQLPRLGMNAEQFFRENKYNERFDIVWRFVAGLFHAEQKVEFFKTIVSNPYDFIGPAQQRLVMRCLAEVGPSRNTADIDGMRDSLENGLKQWMLCENLNFDFAGLAWEMDFPETILRHCLPNASRSLQENIMHMLGRRRTISSPMVDYLVSFLEEDIPSKLTEGALGVFVDHWKALPEGSLHKVVALMGDDKFEARYCAKHILMRRPTLPNSIYIKLVAFLKRDDRISQKLALNTMSRPTLPDEIIVKIMAVYQSSRQDTPDELIELLDKRPVFAEHIISKALELLRHVDALGEKHAPISSSHHLGPGFVMFLMQLISKYLQLAPLSAELGDSVKKLIDSKIDACGFEGRPTILQEIMFLLRDSSPSYQCIAKCILVDQNGLQNTILLELVGFLERPERWFQHVALHILEQQRSLFSDTVLQRIYDLLDDPERRFDAMRALSGQVSLPNETVEKLLTQCRNPATPGSQRQVLVLLLKNQLVLSTKILEALVDILQDDNDPWHDDARDILSNQQDFPSEITKKIIDLFLHGANEEIQRSATCALENQRSLPEKVLRRLMHNMSGNKPFFPIRALLRQHILPSELIPELVMGIPDSDDISYYSHYLYSGSYLPDNVLEHVVHLLTSQHGRVRSIAMDIMIRHTTDLPDRINKMLVSLLDQQRVSDEVVSALLSHPSALTEESLLNLVSWYEHSRSPEDYEYITDLPERCTNLQEMIIQKLVE
ncbi:hypothetical protein M426DRAFT_321936 [Hypoxylon sp. CI-4A]|nr:hypothetical protein M426DRAFT_321936 [Hypoxylon sp. CI-4A]